MLLGELIHPQILAALGACGHGSQILIADGNYPLSTASGPNAQRVYLNLSPGVVDCVQVLQALLSAVLLEAAAVMQPLPEGPHALAEDPPIWSQFEQMLRSHGYRFPLDRIERSAFYEAARSPHTSLAIATGEQRIYANLLLTIGVRRNATG